MPKIAYIEKNLGTATLGVIAQANDIIVEYQEQGFSLTLRQLFYQFVSRGLVPNTQRNYKRLGTIISNARRTGRIDWDSIEDRTRHVRELSHWGHPKDILRSAVESFRLDKWKNQPWRPMVFIEKDALIGVIEAVCEEFDTPYFSCRGYVSDSEMWRMGMRIVRHGQEKAGFFQGQSTMLLHLGDHDPSGIDMTRDIIERLSLFARLDLFQVKRIALNYEQIERYKPPPNPTKLSDSRAENYIREYGNDSWELDALDPKVISELIREELTELLDDDLWTETLSKEENYRGQLISVIDSWEDPK